VSCVSALAGARNRASLWSTSVGRAAALALQA